MIHSAYLRSQSRAAFCFYSGRVAPIQATPLDLRGQRNYYGLDDDDLNSSTGFPSDGSIINVQW